MSLRDSIEAERDDLLRAINEEIDCLNAIVGDKTIGRRTTDARTEAVDVVMEEIALDAWKIDESFNGRR